MRIKLRLLMMALLCAVASSSWADEITYTFNSKSWGATANGSAANWTSGKDGNQFTSGQGVQVTTGATGANATSPMSFTNISKIVVTYCTNAAKGAGTIKLQVGSNTEQSFSVSAPSSGGTTLKTTEFTYSTAETGSVKITVNCTTNSIYINSITITYSTNTNQVATPTFTPAAGEVAIGTTVTFGCATSGVTFHYTTDGSTPTTSSASGSSYTVNSAVTLKVIAVKSGMDDSEVATAEYTVIKPSPELAFSETSVTANIGETFTPPTLTYANGYDGTITYSSSNSAITVNPTTGEVTFDASAAGKTTTITATASETDNFASGTASYVLTIVNPNAVSGNLNNATFNTNYSGSITISEFTSESGTIGNVTVIYAKGTASNAYISDSEIRLYNGSLLTFVAPDGYYIQSLVFNNTLSGVSETTGQGTVSGAMWSCGDDEEVSTVTLTKTTSTALKLSTVTITLFTSESAVLKPTITPATGTYTEAQTVTITNNAEGATVYYTTDGTTPTASSTPYSGPFTLNKNGTYTIKAIAISGEHSSLVATSIITISIEVPTPTFTEASGTAYSAPYTIHLTAPEGYTIYYTTGTASPVTSDGTLSGSALAYNAANGIGEFSKAITISAVAVDQNGNVSEVVTASYTYSGEVQVPYYENFDEGLGNFTTSPQNSGSSDVAWEFQINHDVETYGEERKYAFITGGYSNNKDAYVGSDRLISPVIDLNGLENATMNFIHAGHWFSTLSTGQDTGDETVDLAAKKESCHLQIRTVGENGASEWTDISDLISNWFVQRRENNKNMYDRVNSGDIDLSDYVDSKIQVCFYFTSTSTQGGVWNVLKFAVTGTEPEVDNFEPVTMGTDGYVTYVVQNDIDWVKTLTYNDATNDINIHGYKVVEFTKETAVFVEFGVGNDTGATHDKWYSEDMIPAETPIILKGTQGENHLVIAKHDDVISRPVGNLLYPSYGDVTASAGQRLLVFQKEPEWNASSPYEHYAFYRLATGRTIPNRKAYLNGNDVSETLSINASNPTNGIYLLEDLGKDTSGIVDLTAQQSKAFDPNAAVYDLSGRKVAQGLGHLPKGLYIISGRKVIIR